MFKYIFSVCLLSIVYGLYGLYSIEIRSSHKCFFFIADYIDAGFSINAMSEYSALYFHSSFIATHVINLTS